MCSERHLLVVVVKLDRPSRMNSINLAMGNALKSLKYNLDEATRAVMIVGEGDKASETRIECMD